MHANKIDKTKCAEFWTQNPKKKNCGDVEQHQDQMKIHEECQMWNKSATVAAAAHTFKCAFFSFFLSSVGTF